MSTYKAKGYITCLQCSDEETAGLGCIIRTIDDLVEEAGWDSSKESKKIYRQMFTDDLTRGTYHLMSGENFLEAVLSGGFTDYDGSIAYVYVDGFDSNLGLATNNLFNRFC